MSNPEAAEVFESVSERDSTALFKPQVVALVLTNGEERGPNVMTASWWMLAGYGPFRYLLAVSHKTYTYELIEENPEFVMAAPSTEQIDALALSGMVSGRELDKIDHLGLETVPGTDVEVPLLRNAVGNIELSVLDSFEFENHSYYFGSVQNAYVGGEGLDHGILPLDAGVLAYMGSDRRGDPEGATYRHYADMATATLESFDEDELVASLPDALRERYGE